MPKSNAFTKVGMLENEIDVIREMQSKIEYVQKRLTIFIDFALAAFTDHTKAAILEALPVEVEEGEEPRDCLEEIYKIVREALLVLDPDADYPLWSDIV